jgi:spore maturation protein SpmB
VVDAGLTAYGINPVVHSLLIDGVFAGVGSVLSFLPIIVTLFFFLSILEDTGYMARIAFVMDKALRKIGLSGRSFVPMLIGFGCSVPAIMATRTVSSDRDRKMTILLTPYMSCSAKIPIYAVFTAAFFPGRGALVMICLYTAGILLGILVALALKSTAFRGQPVPFVMELPNYRLPSVQKRGAAAVGQGPGLSAAGLHHHLRRHGDHLVFADLRHPAQRGIRQLPEPAGPHRVSESRPSSPPWASPTGGWPPRCSPASPPRRRWSPPSPCC